MRTIALIWQKLSLVEPFQGTEIIPLITSATVKFSIQTRALLQYKFTPEVPQT